MVFWIEKLLNIAQEITFYEIITIEQQQSNQIIQSLSNIF